MPLVRQRVAQGTADRRRVGARFRGRIGTLCTRGQQAEQRGSRRKPGGHAAILAALGSYDKSQRSNSSGAGAWNCTVWPLPGCMQANRSACRS